MDFNQTFHEDGKRAGIETWGQTSEICRGWYYEQKMSLLGCTGTHYIQHGGQMRELLKGNAVRYQRNKVCNWQRCSQDQQWQDQDQGLKAKTIALKTKSKSKTLALKSNANTKTGTGKTKTYTKTTADKTKTKSKTVNSNQK